MNKIVLIARHLKMNHNTKPLTESLSSSLNVDVKRWIVILLMCTTAQTLMLLHVRQATQKIWRKVTIGDRPYTMIHGTE